MIFKCLLIGLISSSVLAQNQTREQLEERLKTAYAHANFNPEYANLIKELEAEQANLPETESCPQTQRCFDFPQDQGSGSFHR